MSVVIRQKLWEVLMHPAYSPDLAPSDYHLFLALQNFLSDKKLESREDCENRLLDVFANKGQDFYERGIMTTPLNGNKLYSVFFQRILFSDEAHFWLNGYVNKQNCRIWSEANPQVYVETPLHPEKLTVWCALWAGGILLQKR
ncbi:putative transposable element [Trichonephila clavipes]|nr:putative transposable element [Trichonephila clavipes]